MMNTNNVMPSFAACRINPTSQSQRGQILQRLDPHQDRSTQALLNKTIPDGATIRQIINAPAASKAPKTPPYAFEIVANNPIYAVTAQKAEGFLATRILNDMGVAHPEDQIEENIITEDIHNIIQTMTGQTESA